MKRIAKGCRALLAGLALPALLSATVRAQDTARQKPFAAKIGVFFATDPDARRAGGDGMVVLETEYRLQTLIENNTLLSNTNLTIGYTEHNDLRIIPITLSQTFSDSRAEPGTGYYYGLGAGLYITRLRSDSTSGDTKNLFGGFAVVGLNLSTKLFVEAKYHLISRYQSENVSGIQATVGTRF